MPKFLLKIVLHICLPKHFLHNKIISNNHIVRHSLFVEVIAGYFMGPKEVDNI